MTDELDDEDFQCLTQLKLFTAEKNQISGTLPGVLADLELLHTLSLNSNKISGTLPEFLQEMTSLTFLDLQGNTDGTLLAFDHQHKLRGLDLSFNGISGTISETFLAKVERGASFEYAHLSNNFIEAEIPESVVELNVLFKDNKITSIDSAVCDPHAGEAVEKFGSDAILCPPQTWNSLGRQVVEDKPCLECTTAEYYGTTTCNESGNDMIPTPTDPTVIASATLESDTGEEEEEDAKDISQNDINVQHDVLSKLHMKTEGNSWRHQENWLKTADVCLWHSITCENGLVNKTDLSSNKLKGSPHVIELIIKLPALKKLNIEDNKVAISILKDEEVHVSYLE